METNYKQFSKLEIGEANLRFWDESKVELKEFIPEGSDRVIRFFRKKGFGQWDKQAKIISRSGLSGFREPFEIEPWNQILIDEANVYGTAVDKDKEAYLKGQISSEDIMKETKMSVAKIYKEGLVWVGRSQMVCHPDSLIYGEIDEIWYDESNDTYYVGDTKTSSSVDKVGYWYQLAIYVEILRQLNPDKNISHIGKIDWVKIKKQKWVWNRDFSESQWQDVLLTWDSFSDEQKRNHPVYKAKWNEKQDLDPMEETNLVIERDLDELGILSLAKEDIKLLADYKINSVDEFKSLLESNATFQNINSKLQARYDLIKGYIK